MKHIPTGYNDFSHYHDYRLEPFTPALTMIAAGVSRWGPGVQFHRLAPQAYSINVITAGSAWYEHRGFRGELKPGSVALTHAGYEALWKTGSAHYLHKRFIVIGGDVLYSYISSAGLGNRIDIAVRSPETITQLLRSAFAVMKHKKEGFIENTSMVVHRVLLELSASIAKRYPAPLTKALACMHQNLTGSPRLKEICRVSATSARSCARLFKKHFHMAPMQFFLHLKMQQAQHLLLSTDMSIKEIALRTGYDDPLYFSAIFKRIVGSSPRTFRNRPYAATDTIRQG